MGHIVSWKDKLQPASFRGVPFFVEADDATFGRRTQVHEYPQRDKPFAEDLGRATREYTLTAFLVGDDFQAQREKLQQAIEQAGAGQLVHPFYGQLVVSVKDYRVSHSRENGGMCTISIGFVEAGELSFPQAKDRTQSIATAAADKLSVSALSDFTSKFSVDGFADFVSTAALDDIAGVLDTVQTGMKYVKNPGALIDVAIDSFDLGDAAATGSSLQNLFADALSLYEGAATLSKAGQADYYGSHAGGVLDLYHMLAAEDTSTGRTPARRQLTKNRNAVNAIVRRQCLAQAAGAAALMPALVQDDVQDIRARIGAAVDIELLTAPDELIDPLLDLRSSTHKDLTDRARDSARLEVVTPPLPVPACVLAYDLYEDATRGDEIVQRNRVPHPAFISDPVSVLSR